MIKFFRNIQNHQNSAVTLDWVVLIAAIVGLCIAVMSSVGASTVDYETQPVTDEHIEDVASS